MKTERVPRDVGVAQVGGKKKKSEIGFYNI